ncbi:MAG: hypothetical protein ACJ8HQ_07185 [Chthoniobacterales bacterium]
MRREDDQELWDLLGQTKAPAASPFFARNVVRQVRQGGSDRVDFLRWLRPRILAPVAVFALALTFAGISADRMLRQRTGDNPPDVVASIDPQDYEVVADLDYLIASEDDNTWDDDDSLPL